MARPAANNEADIFSEPGDLPCTKGDAAKVIGVSTGTIDYYERIGRLLPMTHTVGGIALYRPSDVKRIALERARSRAERGMTT